MYNIFCGQAAGARDSALAHRHVTDAVALCLNDPAPLPHDGACHAPAVLQTGIRRVDDGVHRSLGDVSPDDPDLRRLEKDFRQ